MPAKRPYFIATASLLAGLTSGVLFGFPSSKFLPPVAGDREKEKLTAVQKDPTRSLANEIAALLPANLWGTGGGGAAAWSKIAELDLAAAKKLASHLDGRDWLSGDDAHTLQMALERWKQLDPPSLLDWIETGSRSSSARYAHSGAFAALARLDLDSALARLDTMPEKFRNNSHRALAIPFAEQDPARAAQFYIDFDSPRRSQHGEIAGIWAKSDPLAALAFYEAAGKKVTWDIVNGWASHDPDGALDWVREQDLEPFAQSSYITAIARRLMEKDPIAGMAVLDELTAGVVRNNAMISLLDGWARQDPAAAAAWASALEDPAAKARATMKISQSVRESNPALALELAEEVPEAKFRQKAFESYAEVRAKEDPDATLAWAEALEDEDRRRSAITSSIAGLATKDLTRAVNYFAATEDKSHKQEMLTKIISNDDLGRNQLTEAREVLGKLSKEDERMAIDTILEVNGEHLPGPLKKLIKVTGSLDTFLDWAEKMGR